ncbi:receptor-binding cancer antigen expressed on SiSo cells [Hetaerina americana]|uniref:receptor-binding cancer antigen expressed on SiSo cells n=1 Tax=Hetaerina americana TaxID=62018 RepID=UPI003A7F28F1
MALNFLLNRLKGLILVFLGVFRRALCCFRRRRRSSSCTPIPLTAVGVVPNNVISSNEREDGPELSWNSWEDNSSPDSVVTDVGQSQLPPVNSIQQQIELYRQSQIRQPNDAEAEQPADDFFQDMAPRITRQQKVLIPSGRRGEGEGQEGSPEVTSGGAVWSPRLAVSSTALPFPANSELEVWDEAGPGSTGWDEAAGDEAWEQVRALRQAKRAAEQQRRRREREGKARLGARVGGTS